MSSEPVIDPPVRLDAVLGLLGIILAVYALVGPVERRSLGLFLRLRPLLAGFSLGTIVILIPLILEVLGARPHPAIQFGLPLVGLGLAAGYPLVGLARWSAGRLSRDKIGAIEDLVLTSLAEGHYDEVTRLLLANRAQLLGPDPDLMLVAFDPHIVRAMIARRNYVHLELLADPTVFEINPAALKAVDIVVPCVLNAVPSVIDGFIERRVGGDERQVSLTRERATMDRTLGSWRWYARAKAASAVIIAACEALESGRFDRSYNLPDQRYGAAQGTSGRSTCPVFRAIQLHFSALQGAQANGEADDIVPADLFHVFSRTYDRSKVSVAWDSAASLGGAHTPFRFLMHEVLRRLEALCEARLAQRLRPDWGPLEVVVESRPQDSVIEYHFESTCEAWVLCLWYLCHEGGHEHVRQWFTKAEVSAYLHFMLRCGFEHASGDHDIGRSLAARGIAKLRERLIAEPLLRALYNEAFSGLDLGKRYVYDGREWLRSAVG